MGRSIPVRGGKPASGGGGGGERKPFDFDESLRVAVRCGVKVSEYGDLTPRELYIIAEEHNNMRQQQREEAITQAYLIAAWHPRRTRRLPKLEKVLEDIRPKRPEPPQTPEQMLEIVKAMHAELVRGG